MAESFALVDDGNLADRVLATESGATPNLTDQLLDLLPAAVYVCAPDGMILRFNRRAAELWGREPLLGDPTGSAAPIACTGWTALRFRTTNVPWRTSCVTAFRS